MAWSSRQVYDVTRIMIYALLGIFLICMVIAAVTGGSRFYQFYDIATIIAQLVMFAGAIVAPIAAIAGARAYRTGQFERKRKPQEAATAEQDRLQRIYNQLSSEDESYLREQLAQHNLSLGEDNDISTGDDAVSQSGKQS
ncbi:MAG: hypothetical protein CL607_10820 [Anaerolineaceae bacterium]|nr:hypothetical protein [Anaerolineaceae bacterium]